MLYRSRPKCVNRIWGSLAGEDPESPIGEIWWIYHEDDCSAVLDCIGSETSRTVADLVSSGDLPGQDRYPVLIKTLHTARRLSVQVHPGAMGKELYKEETWIVLDAGQEAWMMGGLKTFDRQEFRRAVREDRGHDHLNMIPLAPGDAYHLPPGTLHALGPGLTILEVQSNCDVTYRLYDWGRLDAHGRPRELHLEQGLDSVDWNEPCQPVRVGTEGEFSSDSLQARYGIRKVSGRREVSISGGACFFLAGGVVGTGTGLKSLACLISDAEGGSFSLDGTGYLIQP